MFVLLGVVAVLAPEAQAQQVAAFENRWKGAERLAVDSGSLVANSSGNTAWVLEPVDATYVRLRNLNTGLYLHNQEGLAVGPIQPGWWSAMWVLEPTSDGYVRILNRWTSTYLHNENGPLELGSAGEGWFSAMWSQQPVQTRMAFSRATSDIGSHLQSLLSNHTEYGISGGVSSTAATHIQGMAVVGKYWVLSHDNAGNRDGDLIIIDPATRERKKSHTIQFTGDDGYMAAAQGNGDYLAVGTGTNKSVRVFSVSSAATVTELTNLNLSDPLGGSRIENVAFAYHPVHQRHYLLLINGSTNKLYVSSGSALESSTWSVVSQRGSVPYGEAGISLLFDQSSGSFYVVSLGQNGTISDEENSFSVWTLSQADASSPTNMFTASAASPEHRKLTDGSGSFRWGGTAHVLANGNVQVIAAPRDFKLIGDSDFGVWTSRPTWASTAVVTTPTPNIPIIRVRVTSVKCVETTEWGEDEVYLVVDGSRYPSGNESYHDINDGESWSVGASATSTSGVTITLMEYDTTDDRDLIGTFSVPIQKIHGRYTETLRGDDGVYQVTYEVSGQ
ncbi:hypothetical protein BSZ36_00575 [Rubricoccus marinus]|uniref:Uncharacterized protein n=1 Tax=Rubricoccus marinus TaxID=716817 RepID=A0A259TVF8_9BACT|nr:hypothetical protein BSZ36_00575 [Rubricoccus marinus]